MTPEKLRALMAGNDLNAKKTAGMVHVSTSTIYMWLRGERAISKPVWELLVLRLQQARAMRGQGNMVLTSADWSVKP
jgi:hypothetical protein